MTLSNEAEIETHGSSIGSKRFAPLFEPRRATSMMRKRVLRAHRECDELRRVEVPMRGIEVRVEDLDARAIRIFTRTTLLHD